MFVIVLGGMARVGKTEAADILEDLCLDNGFFPKRISFAQPLKEAVALENGYKTDWKKFKAEHPETYRKQCQDIGASRREHDEDYWVRLWSEQLNKELATEINRDRGLDHWRETVVIVDDCRYENELRAAAKYDGCSLFLSKGSRELPEEDAAWRAHESERLAMLTEAHAESCDSLWDWWVVNDADVEQLEEKLELRARYLIGNHPSRWGAPCKCAECQAFRADIQGAEIADGLDDVLKALLKETQWSPNDIDKLNEAFADLKKKLESGEMEIGDFFTDGWWESILDEYDIGDDDD